MKIVVLGATGMLGYEVFRICMKRNIDVHGIVRSKKILIERFGNQVESKLHLIEDVKDNKALENILAEIHPDYLVNCVGIVKQSHLADDYYESIAINALLPHQLQKLGEIYNFRLINVSTDCVFDGAKGFYKETDQPNAYDLYGKSKYLGEVGYGNGITIRTSIIGHEIAGQTHGLLEWFLFQNGPAKGFTKAVFSGLTTLELTNVILNIIIPQELPAGVYQVAAEPISKYNLLKLIREKYHKEIDIVPADDVVIDRSLDGSRFASLTGYTVPAWDDLIRAMQSDFKEGF